MQGTTEPNGHQYEAPREPPAALVDRLRHLRDAQQTGLVERDVAIRLALTAALAGEHLLMLGPPGTAKSLVARRRHTAFEGASHFERLLTRFTVPEELSGPLSIKGLEEASFAGQANTSNGPDDPDPIPFTKQQGTVWWWNVGNSDLALGSIQPPDPGGMNRGYSELDLVDFFDAMTCEGNASKDGIAAVAEPLGYPYDNAAICP